MEEMTNISKNASKMSAQSKLYTNNNVLKAGINVSSETGNKKKLYKLSQKTTQTSTILWHLEMQHTENRTRRREPR